MAYEGGAMTQPAKHTPGPWVVSIGPPEHVKVSPHRTRIIPDPATGRDLIIATAEYGAYGPRNPVEAQANATLIAAAPAMYEALKGCLRVTEAWKSQAEMDGDTVEIEAAVMEIKRIKTALAQAEGKQ